MVNVNGRISDLCTKQTNRANGIVVGRDRIIHLVGITVCIGKGHNRNFQAASLKDSSALLTCINDKDGIRQAAHVFDATQNALQASDIIL